MALPFTPWDTSFDFVYDLSVPAQRNKRVFNDGTTNGKKVLILGDPNEWYDLGCFAFYDMLSVMIIGGKYRPPVNGWAINNGGGYAPATFTFTNCGRVWIEGTEVDNVNLFVDNTPSASENGGDACYIAGKTANTRICTIQNHWKNVRGAQNPSDAHADVLQIGSNTMGHCADVEVFRQTSTGNYQHYFLDPQAGVSGNVDGGMDSLRMRQVNCRRSQNVTGFREFFWYSSQGNWDARGCPIILEDCWADGAPGEGLEGTVWPANTPGSNNFPSAYQGKIGSDSTGRYMHWPDLPTVHKISGRVYQGVPPGGDFCPEGAVGFGYFQGKDIRENTPPPVIVVGPATVGTDTGQLSAGIVTFGADETTKTVTIPISPDAANEGDEYFTVELASPVGCTLGNSVTRVMIKNVAPGTPSVSIPTTLTANEGTKTPVVITKTGVGACSVVMATKAITAHYADDYNLGLVPTTFTFEANETTKTWMLDALADNLVEGDETLRVNLSDPIGCTIGNSECLVTIKDLTVPPPPGSATTYAIPKSHNDDNLGGIGKPIYQITKVSDDGSVGTARWAFTQAQSGGGLVLSAVQGFCTRTADIALSGAKRSNVTYCGFTGPGPLVFRGSWNFGIRGSFHTFYDLIVEREYNARGATNGDGFQLLSDGPDTGDVDSNFCRKVKFVRCYTAYSQDEAIQIFKKRSTQYTANIQSDISCHWSIMHNPINRPSLYQAGLVDNSGVNHGFNAIVGGFIPRTDWQMCLFTNGYARNPRYSGPAQDFLIANCVMLNWGYAAVNLQSEIEFPLTYQGSIIGCVAISGPDTTDPYLVAMHNNPFVNTAANPTRIHISGNSGLRGPGTRAALPTLDVSSVGKTGTGDALPAGWTPSAARQDTLTDVVPLTQAKVLELMELHAGPFPLMRRANPSLLPGVTQAIAQMKREQTAKIINHENEGPGLSAPAFVYRPLTGDLAPPSDHTNVDQVRAYLRFMEAKVTNNPTI